MTFLSGTNTDQPASPDALETKRVLMFLAEGFEDAEAVTVLDVFGWTKYRPDSVTIEVGICALHERVNGAFGTSFSADVLAGDANAAAYDALVVCGGFHNLGFDEAYAEPVYELVRAFRTQGKPIAALCTGVVCIARADVLDGGRATTYAFSSRHDNIGALAEHGCEYVAEPVVEWNGIVSCAGPGSCQQAAERLLQLLAGTQAAASVVRYRAGVDRAVPAGHPEKPEGETGRTLLERMNSGNHEQLANWGLDKIEVRADAHALDIGCGGGANIRRLLALAPRGVVRGVDYSATSVEMSRELNANAISAGACAVEEADVHALPFPDATFDTVTAFETVYFWQHIEHAFAEVRRVLKDGGTFLVCNETDGTELGTHVFAHAIDGMRVPTGEELTALAKQAGFTSSQVFRDEQRGYLAVACTA